MTIHTQHRRSGLRIKPLVFSLALALGIGSPLALAHEPGRESNELRREALLAEGTPDRRGLLEKYPAGHPYHTQLLEVLNRPEPERPHGRATLPVTNCNNSGPGSLRNQVLAAADGDTIDMSGLVCSGITLTTGSLVTALDNLVLVGRPGLFVDGNDANSVFIHLGAGTVEFRDLIVTGGRKYSSTNHAPGGCIYSLGSVLIDRTTVKYCVAEAQGPAANVARGGGIFADGTISLLNSTVLGNTVINGTGGGVHSNEAVVAKYSNVSSNETTGNRAGSGAGLFVNGSFTSKYNTISNNEGRSFGGGVAVRYGDVLVTNSTISGNTARHAAGMDMFGSLAGDSASIINSTIANNEAYNTSFGGGLFTNISLEMRSSTVSGNVERHDEFAKYGGGLRIAAGTAVDLRNTLISGNNKYTLTGTEPLRSDISSAGQNPLVVTGSGNLVGQRTNTTMPAGTIEAAARLGPLTNNGGLTRTMRPLRNSRAINRGVSAGTLEFDQRGTGFARTIGAGVDIGAFETDTLFTFDFEETETL